MCIKHLQLWVLSIDEMKWKKFNDVLYLLSNACNNVVLFEMWLIIYLKSMI